MDVRRPRQGKKWIDVKQERQVSPSSGFVRSRVMKAPSPETSNTENPPRMRPTRSEGAVHPAPGRTVQRPEFGFALPRWVWRLRGSRRRCSASFPQHKNRINDAVMPAMRQRSCLSQTSRRPDLVPGAVVVGNPVFGEFCRFGRRPPRHHNIGMVVPHQPFPTHADLADRR